MPLAKVGDPLVTEIGAIVFDDDSKKSETVSEQEYQARQIIPALKRFNPVREASIDELPEGDKNDQIAVIVVVGLRLMGLSFDDIGEYLNVKRSEIDRILELTSMRYTFDRVFRSIVNVNADSVQGRIASHANGALNTMLSLMYNEKMRGDVRFKAADSILDRAGTNAEQFFAQNEDGKDRDDELRITFMTEGEHSDTKVSVEVGRRRG